MCGNDNKMIPKTVNTEKHSTINAALAVFSNRMCYINLAGVGRFKISDGSYKRSNKENNKEMTQLTG